MKKKHSIIQSLTFCVFALLCALPQSVYAEWKYYEHLGSLHHGNVAIIGAAIYMDELKKYKHMHSQLAYQLTKLGYDVWVENTMVASEFKRVMDLNKMDICIFNGHGSEAGQLVDTNSNLIHYDTFVNATKLKLLILGNCYGDRCRKNYANHANNVIYWDGLAPNESVYRYIRNDALKECNRLLDPKYRNRYLL